MQIQKMDHDGNGKLERHEIRDVLTASGFPVNSEEIERIMSTVDRNGDGYIDYDGNCLSVFCVLTAYTNQFPSINLS